MTTQGDDSPISADFEQSRGRVRSGSRGGSRRVVSWVAVAVALAGGGWLFSRPNPGDWLPGLGPSSKDAARAQVIGSPPPTSATDPDPFEVERYFPQARAIDMNGYKGRRTGGRQGNDCNETLLDPAKTALHDNGCQGYLTVSFSRQDGGRVLTSVTVLRFADDGAAARVVELMRAQPELLRFVLPGNGIAAPSPAAAAKNDQVSQAESVHHYVTVTTSRFADGHGAATAPDPELRDATSAAAYTAAAAFMWS